MFVLPSCERVVSGTFKGRGHWSFRRRGEKRRRITLKDIQEGNFSMFLSSRLAEKKWGLGLPYFSNSSGEGEGLRFLKRRMAEFCFGNLKEGL